MDSKFKIGEPVRDIPRKEGAFDLKYKTFFDVVKAADGMWVPIEFDNSSYAYPWSSQVKRHREYEISNRRNVVYVRLRAGGMNQ